METMLSKLNERQYKAVTLPKSKSSLILASAGSGKTQLMIMRIVYLIKHHGVDPSNIMSVTFTNKASKEMRERLDSYLPLEQSRLVTMGTFHKICIVMLKQFGDAIGLDKSFAIADSSDQQSVMKEALLNSGESASKQDVRDAIGMVSNIKNKMYTPTQLLSIISEGSKQYNTTTYNIYQGYQDGLAKLNMLDFDDILLDAVRLLETDLDTRTYYQKRYTHINVDEMQDVNPVQYALIRLLAGKDKPTQFAVCTLLAVGDDFQTIYSFRGSSMEIIMNFEKDFPEAMVIKLEQNYRSTKAIVHTANGLIKHNIFQKEKTSFTTNLNGDPISVYSAKDGEDESIFVAQEITNLIAFNGYKHNEIAILYRTNILSREIEHALINAQLPYEIVGSTSFFGRKEIKDTIAYLKLVCNPLDEIALERTMNITPGLGKTTIETIKANALLTGQPLTKAMKEYKAGRKLATEAIESLRNTLISLYEFNLESNTVKYTVAEMINSTWEMTGYKAQLESKKTEETKARLENMEELLAIATLYDTTAENPSLKDFLESSVLHPSDEVEEVADAVQLMTIHASKGLQYKAVFVIGMNEQLLPHQNSFMEADGIEEERRLAYVAITRAEERLYLTHAESRYMYGRRQQMSVSRFIEELPVESTMELSGATGI